MTNQKAAEILDHLICQLDEEIAKHEEYRILLQPDVLIALHKAINALNAPVQPVRELQRSSRDDRTRAQARKMQQQYFPNAGKPWTITDDEILEMLFCDNVPLQHLCEKLGRTPDGILSRMVRLGFIEQRGDYPGAHDRSGVSSIVWSQFEICRLEDAVRNGMTIRQLAEEFNTTEKAIEARLFYMGFSSQAPNLHLKPTDKT